MAELRRKRQTMRHYDQSAMVYDVQYFEEQEEKIKIALSKLSLEKENTILDVGCGTGLLFPHLAMRVRLVVGLDISSPILAKAREKSKVYSNTTLVRGDADYMPFQNETFDTAFAITLLQNIPKPLRSLNEMKRVTKQNATISATGLKKAFTQKEFTQLLKEAKLQIKVMKLDQNHKEYVAICTNSQRKP